MSNARAEQRHLRVDPGFRQNHFCHVEHLDFVMTSPNTKYLPAPPPPYEKTSERNYLVFWRYPRYIPDNMPHLAFLHKQPRLHGPIFKRLDVRFGDVPIVRAPGEMFILHCDVIRSWQRLEIALVGIQDLLLRPSHTNGFRNLDTGALPWHCGYQRPHRLEKDARFCAMKSRDAFILLAALCSFAISFYRTGDQAKQIVPPWHTILMAKSYSPEWLELLEGTFVCDFSRGARIGGYIRANETGLFPQLRAFLDSNVPLWIEWHIPTLESSNPPYAKPFRPTEDDTNRAITLARTNTHQPIYGSNEWTRGSNPSFYQGGEVPYDEGWDGEHGEHGMIHGDYVDPDDVSDYGSRLDDEDKDVDPVLEHPPSSRSSPPAPRPSPPAPRRILEPAAPIAVVHAGSGQPPGVNHTNFLKHRLADRTAAVKEDSPSEFKLRMDAEDKAKKGHKVRVKAVFLWIREGGSWVRTIVNKGDISTVWARFPQHQRFYSYDHQEWDICPFMVDDDNSQSTLDPPPEGEAPHGDVSCAEDMRDAYDTTRTALSQRLSTLKLKQLLELRYGFTVPNGYSANPPNAIAPQFLTYRQSDQAKFRLHGRSTDNFENNEAVREMWNRILLNKVARGLPAQFDMSPHAPSPVSFTTRNPFDLAIVPGPDNTKICVMGVKGKRLSEQWFLLAFRDFSTVVQIFREGWTTGILDTGRQLLKRGIPFNTVVVREHRPVAVERGCHGLGHRSIGYVPQLRDYAHYESQRSKLLREHDGVYAWVALKMGGLYWRLAMEAADDTEKLVKLAMKARIFSRPVGQVVSEVLPGQFLIDDQLSPAAAAVLSGLYAVDTSLPHQVEHISWWPKQELWYASELNVGYWSEACEDWYQTRLASIREGRAKMLNATGWRLEIRGKGGHVAMFRRKFSDFAQDFVEKHGSPLHVNRRT